MAGLTLVSRAGLLVAPCPLSCPASVVRDVPVSFPARGDCLCQFCTSEVNWGQAGPAGLRQLVSSMLLPRPCLHAALSQMCCHHVYGVAPADSSKLLRGSGITPPKPFPLWRRAACFEQGGPAYWVHLQPCQVKPKPKRCFWRSMGSSGCRCDSGMDTGAGICFVDPRVEQRLGDWHCPILVPV